MGAEIITHNVNGFERSRDFVRDLCYFQPNCIYGLQAHWLSPSSKHTPEVDVLKTYQDLDGWGTIAMKSAVGSKIMNGRLVVLSEERGLSGQRLSRRPSNLGLTTIIRELRKSESSIDQS